MVIASAYCDEKSVSDIWILVQNKLKKEYGEATYKSWLSKLEVASANNGHLILLAPTKFMREWIITHYKDVIRKMWKEYDTSIYKIEILIAQNVREVESCEKEESLVEFSNSNIPESKIDIEILSSILDERYTFDNFVVGAPNELAYAAARSVAESSKVQSETNPLFLYGPVGLGKTHLMNAIAWHILKHDPSRNVVYMSAEKFMYEFVKALRDKDIMTFKEKFRNVKVLMIDDFQFMCGKNNTQQEFFHTFNVLIDNNCQIVISCDRSPSDLDDMEERIKSRLGWGLVADVHATTYELRLGILQSKIEQSKANVPLNVIEFLAAKISSNVRELEGALNKVIAHSKLIGREINIESTQEILRDLLRSNEKSITIDDIQRKVAEHFNIKVADMSSSRRLRLVARPRQIAMYLSKTLTNKSLAEIGKKFGGKDHTTVMHAVKTIEKLTNNSPDIQEDIRLLGKILQN